MLFQHKKDNKHFPIKDWINTGYPKIYWLPGFFFAQSFLTGTMQNYARKYKVPIDFVKFNYELIDSNSVEVKK